MKYRSKKKIYFLERFSSSSPHDSSFGRCKPEIAPPLHRSGVDRGRSRRTAEAVAPLIRGVILKHDLLKRGRAKMSDRRITACRERSSSSRQCGLPICESCKQGREPSRSAHDADAMMSSPYPAPQDSLRSSESSSLSLLMCTLLVHIALRGRALYVSDSSKILRHYVLHYHVK